MAARANVGIRTVFRRFSDVESLFAEMDAQLQAEALPLLLGGRANGTPAERARALVHQRVAFFERIAPYKRSGTLKRRRSPFLRDRHTLLVRALQADLLRWLPELQRAPTAINDALDLTTSFEAWDRLRSEQSLRACERISIRTGGRAGTAASDAKRSGPAEPTPSAGLSRARAQAAMERTVLALIKELRTRTEVK